MNPIQTSTSLSNSLVIDKPILSYASGFRFECKEPIKIVPGDKICLMGRNGSGKSTFLKLLSGEIEAQSGSIQFQGQKIHPGLFAYKRQIGYLPQEPLLPRWTNAKDLIHYLNGLRTESSAQSDLDSLDLWGIADYAHKPLAFCSYGMQKRVSLHLALSHSPRVILLDEPFSGLDINHASTLESWIEDAQDRIVIMSTHSSYTAAKLCNRCLLLRQGRLCEITDWPILTLEQRMQQLSIEVKQQ